MRIKKNKNNSFFHPFEIAFCGYSNSGKTTLISSIIKKLSSDFDIAYLKHDAHKFNMDHKGKDTAVMSSSGAKCVLINDSTHHANIGHSPLEQSDVVNAVVDSDILLIEGHKFSKIPKFVIMADDANKEKMIENIKQGEITDIIAIISESPQTPFTDKYPFFSRNDIAEISNFTLEYFSQKIPQKINGLILTGGKSQRMSQDKGGIQYRDGLSQVDYSKQLLNNYCDEVFVSCRQDQKELEFLKGQNNLYDSFPSVGPATGILSAQFKDPTTAWLVLACDLPYLEENTLTELIKKRNPFKNATCFLNPKRQWPEPLCTIYEPKSFIKLMQYFAQNRPCPRKVLFNSNIEALKLTQENALDNVNTPLEKEDAINYINSTGELHAN